MMYNLSLPHDKARAQRRFNELAKANRVIELKLKEMRSPPQNRYLHLILGWFAIEYGETMEYVKQNIFKHVNKNLFEYERTNPQTGEIRKAYKSTSALTTAELTTAIEVFRSYAAKEAGIYLPAPGEDEFLQWVEIEIEMSKNSQYL